MLTKPPKRHKRQQIQDLTEKSSAWETAMLSEMSADLMTDLQGSTPSTKESADDTDRPLESESKPGHTAPSLADSVRHSHIWRAPCRVVAKGNRKLALFGEGEAPFWSTSIEELDVISFGTVMYFKLLCVMCTCFIVMSVFALPIAWVMSQGTQIEDNALSSAGWFTLATMANMGTDTARPELITGKGFNFSHCGRTETYEVNGTFYETEPLDCDSRSRRPYIKLEFLEFEMLKDLWEVAIAVTVLDVLYSLVFLITTLHLPVVLSKLQKVLDAGYLSASDYAVQVRGLPKETDLEELRKFFSDLYDPTKPQSYSHHEKNCFSCVAARKSVKECTIARYKALRRTKAYRTVQQNLTGHKGHHSRANYLGGWVTNITLCLHNQQAIQGLQDHVSVVKRIEKLKTYCAKYSANSSYKFKSDKKVEKGKKELMKMQEHLEKLKTKIRTILFEPAEPERQAADEEIKKQSEVAGAFVIFEHQESRRRCVADYAPFNSFGTRFRMPPPLMFKGHKISVVRAPEPATIIWENMESTDNQKLCRRMSTCCATFFLMIIALTIIIAVKGQSSTMQSTDVSLCPDQVMATYYQPKGFYMETGETGDSVHVYDFSTVIPDFVAHSWDKISPNATYGYDPVPSSTDRCPLTYVELGIKAVPPRSSSYSTSFEETFQLSPVFNRSHFPIGDNGLALFFEYVVTTAADISSDVSEEEEAADAIDASRLKRRANIADQLGSLYPLAAAQAAQIDAALYSYSASDNAGGQTQEELIEALEMSGIVVAKTSFEVRTSATTTQKNDLSGRRATLHRTYAHVLVAKFINGSDSNMTTVLSVPHVHAHWDEPWPALTCLTPEEESQPGDPDLDRAPLCDAEEEEEPKYVLDDDTRPIDACYSPCYNGLDYLTKCDTYKCHEAEHFTDPEHMTDFPCEKFWVGNVPGCFCHFVKLNYTNGTDWLGYIPALYEMSSDYPMCTTFIGEFGLALTISAVVVVAMINIIMNILISSLAEYELHDSYSKKLSSVMQKAFIVRFINTAIVLMIIQSDGLPGTTEEVGDYHTGRAGNHSTTKYLTWSGLSEDKDDANTGIFQGEFGDFTTQWYTASGYAITLQMIINLFEPHIAVVITRVLFSIQQTCAMHLISTQEGLNTIYRGSSFGVNLRYSQILNTIFVTMLFASGLPMLVPICAGALVLTFLLDKWMLFRFYNTDLLDNLDGSLASTASTIMPVALLMHLAFGFWMYSNSDVTFSSKWGQVSDTVLIDPFISVVDVGSVKTINGVTRTVRTYDEFLSDYEDVWGDLDVLRIIPRSIRWNTFPIFMLFLIVLTIVLVKDVLWKTIKPIADMAYGSILMEAHKYQTTKVAPEENQQKREQRNRDKAHAKLEKRAMRHLKDTKKKCKKKGSKVIDIEMLMLNRTPKGHLEAHTAILPESAQRAQAARNKALAKEKKKKEKKKTKKEKAEEAKEAKEAGEAKEAEAMEQGTLEAKHDSDIGSPQNKHAKQSSRAPIASDDSKTDTHSTLDEGPSEPALPPSTALEPSACTESTMAEMEADADSKAARAEMSKSLSNAADADGDGDVDLLDLHYLDWRELLYDFYENYQECQLDEVDDILLKFRGREVELFQALEHKYIHAPYGVYAKKARKLKSRELNELDRMVYRADMVYEPSYTGVCRQPIRLMDELDFRQHMINKFDGNLGGWKRLVTEGPDGLPHKMRAGMVYYNQTWNRDSDPDDVLPDYKRGDEKRTWQIIHHYAPFHYDIDDNERYHDALDMSFYMESYAPPSPILKSDSAASSNGDGPEPDALLLPPASTRGLVQGPASISPATPLASAKPTCSVASISTKDAKASLEASDQLDMEEPQNGIHEL